MKSRKGKLHNKLPYAKPILIEIELIAEEVLGVGCKIATGTGPTGAICVIAACDQEGS